LGATVKHLTIVRHAKSSWKHPGLADRERPLNGRGTHDAPMMGQRLAERGYRPDLILSSPATRALTTATVMAEALGCSPADIEVDERIYGAGVAGLIRLVQEVDDGVERIMLFGHNPELTGLVNRLARVSLDNLPTCGMAQLEFAFDTWAELGSQLAVRADIDYPKRTS
jgi:phosphohistidine phosphatase